MNTTQTNPVKIVYTVVENKNGKSFWVRIGAAFTNHDGSLTLKLDALPVNGTLQVREPQAWDDRRTETSAAASAPNAPRATAGAFA